MPKARSATSAVDSPWPETATADQLGALLGLSGRRVRELGADGTFPKAPGGRYVVLASVAAYLQTLRTAAKAKPAPDPQVAAAALDGRQQRARLAKLQADRVELDLQRERGELVEAGPLRIRLATMIVAVRNRIMAVAPQAKGQLPHLTVDDIEVLEDMTREALEGLAADPRLFGSDADDEVGGEDDTDNEEDDDT